MSHIVYIALGDSLSAGQGDPDAQGNSIGWARRMCSILSDATGETYAFTKLAVNSAKIGDVRADQVPALAGTEPGLLTVTVGVNDILGAFDAGRFAAEVAALFDDLVKTGATVATITLPNMAHLLPLPDAMRRAVAKSIEMVNDGIRKGADARGVLYVDSYAAPETAAPEFWADDRRHPSTLGHQQIAGAVAELLLSAGPRRGIPERLATPAAGVP
jgi:lysophospholipase L1-like esterase